jgi:hypothetical protein
MSRRPSLPGAAELFRATGGGHAPAEPAPSRDGERPLRLRPADLDAPAVGERTASVTPLAASVPARTVDDAPTVAPTPPPAPRVADSGPPVVPVAPVARAPGSPAATALDDPPVRRPTTNGVRQTRRQRVRTVGERRPSGRERHEEKITVYCSAEELLDLETARLSLRGEHGLVVDRGRIVREAVAIILADLEAKGDDSILVRRLREL